MTRHLRARILKPLLRALAALGVRVLAATVPRFSRRAVTRLGRGAGLLGYLLLPRLRRVALANLDLAFGDRFDDRQRRRIALQSIRNLTTTFLLLFWSPRLSLESLDQVLEVDRAGLEQMRAAARRGCGVIGLTLHFGDWELAGIASALLGIPMAVVAQGSRSSILESVLNRLRSISGNRIVPRRNAALKLLKALERGQVIAALIDLNAPRRGGGIWAEFFGVPVYSQVMVAELARRTRAPIFFGVAHPLGGGRSRLAYTHIPYRITDDRASDLRAITQSCLHFCQSTIEARPEWWHWTYPRWRRCPTPDTTRFPFYARYRPLRESRSVTS